MCAHNRRINHQPFVVGVSRKCVENHLPNARLCPANKAFMHRCPFTIFGRQITPRRTCSANPHHRFNEFSIICTRTPSVAFLTRQNLCNRLPLLVSKPMSCRHKTSVLCPHTTFYIKCRQALMPQNAAREVSTLAYALMMCWRWVTWRMALRVSTTSLLCVATSA